MTTKEKKELGLEFKLKRIRAGLTQKQLAKKCFISIPKLMNLENHGEGRIGTYFDVNKILDSIIDTEKYLSPPRVLLKKKN